MSKLTISCNSVDKYFQLPKSEREYKGLYKVPYALPTEFLSCGKIEKGWTTFYEKIKAEYPIQYFFRVWLFSYDNPVYSFLKHKIICPIDAFKHNTKRCFKPCHPRWRKVLPRHQYSDITELIVSSNFALICDFYHEEVENGWVDWSSDEKHKQFYKELKSYVKWIEEDRTALQDKIDKTLDKAIKNRKYKKDGTLDYNATYLKVEALEQEYERRESEVLTWLITNRKFFWT